LPSGREPARDHRGCFDTVDLPPQQMLGQGKRNPGWIAGAQLRGASLGSAQDLRLIERLGRTDWEPFRGDLKPSPRWADSNGRRNALKEEVAMSIRKRRSDRFGRAPLLSPGRPPVAGRNERRQFWLAIGAGLSSEDAAVAAGVSQPVRTRWFRKAGGMPPAMFRSSAKPFSGRSLSLLGVSR
jgi:hypothetical protein